MQPNPWFIAITAGGYILAAAIALWNARQRPHETLKTYVDIWKELPEDSAVKLALWREIETQLGALTTKAEPRDPNSTTPIERELNPGYFRISLLLSVGIAGLGALFVITSFLAGPQVDTYGSEGTALLILGVFSAVVDALAVRRTRRQRIRSRLSPTPSDPSFEP
ncbi:hypothetical protein IU436_29640 [Nocardia farcinica]|uniref:hypothetical protein n=1 Tax=Nocardia farcinica TaxID=37329 RepID=UPI00189596F3|nr:hypothetical protein [Nocardia farcinica]MBF6422763.1 hypothetical protein [Nocardia farcinica]MBF6434483.1 hypothetical protein [Nocardia farcinica]MBF6505568.1 hypothetical protein [Nocardia farcinica]